MPVCLELAHGALHLTDVRNEAWARVGDVEFATTEQSLRPADYHVTLVTTLRVRLPLAAAALAAKLLALFAAHAAVAQLMMPLYPVVAPGERAAVFALGLVRPAEVEGTPHWNYKYSSIVTSSTRRPRAKWRFLAPRAAACLIRYLLTITEGY